MLNEKNKRTNVRKMIKKSTAKVAIITAMAMFVTSITGGEALASNLDKNYEVRTSGQINSQIIKKLAIKISTVEEHTQENPTLKSPMSKNSTSEPQTSESPSTEPTLENTTTEQPTTKPSTTEESTTEPATTELPTTEPPTTEPPTTEPTTPEQPTTPEKVKPWGKNSKGQFVNGNGKVIVGATMKGIDVSHHQGKIDWKKVADSDVDYAIIRCGYGNNEKKQDDQYWKYNVSECEKYNIPYGVYIYSYATTTKMAESEAAHVLRLIKGHTLNFPIYFDMEDSCQKKLTDSQRVNIANTFINNLKVEGYECGIYASLNWWKDYLPISLAEKNTWKWIAQYNNNACTYNGEYQMWQSTSKGKVNGIDGYVDLNFWFGEVRTTSYNIKKPVKPITPPKRVTIKSVKPGKKKATLKWKKVTGAKGYEIQYSTKSNFKKKYTTSKLTTKTSIVVKQLKKKKKYYFRVRAYKTNIAKKKIYSLKWSKTKKVKIKK